MYIVLSDEQVKESINVFNDVNDASKRKHHLENLSMDNIHVYKLTMIE